MTARARVRVERREPATAPRGRAGRHHRQRRVPPVVEQALHDSGQPLDPGTRSAMETAIGYRFDEVRIHTRPEAARAAVVLDAHALTVGQDILFAASRYRPDTVPGRRLLAHELVHALQHGQPVADATTLAPVASPPSRDDPLEREADTAAERIANGFRLPAGSITVAAAQARNRLALAPASAAAVAPVEVPDSPEAVRDIADEITRLFGLDPDDIFGRVRRRLARLAAGTRRALLAELQGRIPAPAQARMAELVTELSPAEPTAAEPAQAPEEATERIAAERYPAEATVEAPEPAQREQDRDGLSTDGVPHATAPEALGVGLSEPVAEAAPQAPVEEPEGEAAVPELTQSPEQEDAAAEVPAAPGRPIAEAAEPAAAAGAVAESVGAQPPTVVPGAAVEAEEPEPADDEDEAEPGVEVTPAEELEQPPEATATAPTAPEAEAPSMEALEGEAVTEGGEAEPVPTELGETAPDLGGEALGSVESETAGVELATAAEAVEPGVEEAGGGDVVANGGGGGTPIPELSEPTVPAVSGMEPEQAMAAVAALPPAQLQAGLGGVAAASSRSVGDQRTALTANPPSLERPSGTPTATERAAEEAALPTVPAAPARVDRAPQAPAPPPIRPPALVPLGAPPTDGVRPPDVPGGPDSELSEDGARELRASMQRLPTRDPALDEETAGPPPRLVLEGSADPEQARAQRERLEQASRQAQLEGRRDVTEPMGEAGLYPEVPTETLRAELGAAVPAPVPGAPAPVPAATVSYGGPAAGAVTPGGDDAAISIVAEQERGEELRTAVTQAHAEMAMQRQQQQATATEAQAHSQEEVAELVRTNADEQAAERRGARTEVYERRREWSGEQRKLVEGAQGEADTESRRGAADVVEQQQTAQRQAADHIVRGNQDAAVARREGERRAERERERGEREASSGGVLGWLARKARALFDAIKRGIQAAFEWARARVRDAIQAAQRLAAAVIDRARQFIVAAIRRVGEALIAIGDRLLAGFPGLRDRFRRAIRERVERVVARVNELADALKAGVQRALNFLGAALDAALGLLERGMLAAVDAVGRAVQGAIQFARSVIQALATFAVLIRDVAANPIQWLRNLGSAVVDGIRNHLWRALKQAVRQWFDQKLDEVLGLGLAIWNLLRRGGISLAAIGPMVWAGLKQIIPTTLIQLLVEKLVAMIVPAAGAVMVIIEGLRAAWGTVSRIIQAFERFFAFLRAVRTGRAGPQFANTVAAAAVAVIDFVANWLLMRLRRPAGAIAGRVRAIAKRIGAKLRGLRRAIRRRPSARPPRKRGHTSQQQADRDRRRREQRERAERETKTTLERLLGRRVAGLRLRAHMAWLKRRWRWRTLEIRPRDRNAFTVHGGFSPSSDLIQGDQIVEVREVDLKLPEAAFESGAAYQGALRPYFRRDVAAEIAAGRPVEVTTPATLTLDIPAAPAHRLGSTLEKVRFRQERGIRVGGLLRRPEAIAEVVSPVPGTRRRQVSEVHVLEATLDVNFSFANKGVAPHKEIQIPGTLWALTQRYRNQPNIRFVYRFFAPYDLPTKTREFLEAEVRRQRLTNVRIIWTVAR